MTWYFFKRFYLMCFCALLFYNFVSCVTTQQTPTNNTWSIWKICSGIKRCKRFRELECGKNRGLNCTNPGQDRIAFEQQLRGPECFRFEDVILSNRTFDNCLKYNNYYDDDEYDWWNCEGACYDAVRRVRKRCRGRDFIPFLIGSCRFTEHQRCYNPRQCLGTWSNWSPIGSCSVSCGGGNVNETRECRYLNGTGKLHKIVGKRLSFVYNIFKTLECF